MTDLFKLMLGILAKCVGESVIGGDKSYVELLTCLEMSQDAKR